jgi:hypothetical protein
MSGKTARHIRSFPPEAERAAARALQLHLSTERHGAGGFHLLPRNDPLGRRFRVGAFKILGFDESPEHT